jgi:hypothetical protein
MKEEEKKKKEGGRLMVVEGSRDGRMPREIERE